MKVQEILVILLIEWIIFMIHVRRLMDMGYTINRPPRDGHMAFVRSPDKISIEILQEGNLEPKEPWASMENTGTW